MISISLIILLFVVSFGGIVAIVTKAVREGKTVKLYDYIVPIVILNILLLCRFHTLLYWSEL